MHQHTYLAHDERQARLVDDEIGHQGLKLGRAPMRAVRRSPAIERVSE
jgi:hypothetical protein